ncbi:MAG: tRNA dihydrouridine synthase DusB [Clostridia bacterium]
MKIGNIELKNPYILAPLAGIADVGFRKVCRDAGASLSFTEMVSCKGLKYGNCNTIKLLKKADNENPVGVQIFGSDVDVFAEIVGSGVFDEFDVIDINMGCPVPKVAGKGEGANLMLHEELAEQLIMAVVKNTTKPVTVKFRKGWDESLVNAVEFAKMCEGAGASAVTVHGRTRQQLYSGKADYGIIAKVKEAVKIPVIGNGDVFSKADAEKMFKETNCDGIMIARGAIGAPWLFSELLDIPYSKNKFDTMREHFELLQEAFDEHHAVVNMRKHFSAYFKGLKNGAVYRGEINKLNTKVEIFELLKLIESNNTNERD